MSTPPLSPYDASRTLGFVRVVLLWILIVGLAGTGLELFLLEHTEELAQLIPLVLMGLGLAVLTWHLITRSPSSVRVLQGLMVLFIVAGAVGVILHFKGNVEFELEMNPEFGGFALFREAMMGATPALAPGVMAQFGVLGLLYAWRHPALVRRSHPAGEHEAARQ